MLRFVEKWGYVFIMCSCTLSRWWVIVWYVKFFEGLRRQEDFLIRCFSCYVVFFIVSNQNCLFHVFLWCRLFYTIVCCFNMGRWAILVFRKCSFSIICTRMLLIAVRLTFRAVFANADYTKLVLKLYVRKNKAHC
jgi:hypothetical protein